MSQFLDKICQKLFDIVYASRIWVSVIRLPNKTVRAIIEKYWVGSSDGAEMYRQHSVLALTLVEVCEFSSFNEMLIYSFIS